jgi:PfaD family protein
MFDLDARSARPTASPFDRAAILEAVERFREPAHVVRDTAGRTGVAWPDAELPPGCAVHGVIPSTFPEWLGDRGFCETHGTRFPYAVGAMANLLTGEEMVVAAGRAGLLGFLGAAGAPVRRVDEGLRTLGRELGADVPWGCNLIHTPTEPGREMELVELLLRREVRRICASAFTEVTPAVVRYAAHGMRVGADGAVVRANHLFAKLSRPEVATAFASPAPAPVLDALVRAGLLSPAEAHAARRVPLAGDITVEGDSGGHTDNGNTLALLPVVIARVLRVSRACGCDAPRVGAAGGLGTPGAVAAAFSAGVAYVLTGSVNQATRESPTSLHVKRLLAGASMHDVATAPSADMFELGARVQVLKRGTLFAGRARRLHDAYVQYDGLESIPAAVREKLEREVLGATFDEIWARTQAFFLERDPAQIARADADPKHRMALVFRWYLGMASKWAIEGDPRRVMDYQIWCGPAMGAFNAWVEGSFLAALENRTIAEIALNLLEGAAANTRAQQLRAFGVPVPAAAFEFRPRPLTSGRAREG